MLYQQLKDMSALHAQELRIVEEQNAERISLMKDAFRAELENERKLAHVVKL